jgi:methylated-DNA-[protein]-cysteine S-methyltransferase
VRGDALLDQAAEQLARYFAGQAVRFTVALDLHGTAFQRKVWDALLKLPRGSTRSYADLAVDVGMPSAVRAVGAAIGKNPVSVIVPCHRVLGRSGALTGYAGGVEKKHALLRLEGIALPVLKPSPPIQKELC